MYQEFKKAEGLTVSQAGLIRMKNAQLSCCAFFIPGTKRKESLRSGVLLFVWVLHLGNNIINFLVKIFAGETIDGCLNLLNQ